MVTRGIRCELFRPPHESFEVVTAENGVDEALFQSRITLPLGRDVRGHTQEDVLGRNGRPQDVPRAGSKDVEGLPTAQIATCQYEDRGVQVGGSGLPDLFQQLQRGDVGKVGIDEDDIWGDPIDGLRRLAAFIDLHDRIPARLQDAFQRPGAPLLGNDEGDGW